MGGIQEYRVTQKSHMNADNAYAWDGQSWVKD